MQTQGVATKERKTKLFPSGPITQVLNRTGYVMKEYKLHNRALRKKKFLNELFLWDVTAFHDTTVN